MKALQIIESAYRCTIEEQDDPAIWVSHAMKKAGAEIGILLRGNAVNYAVKDQDASGLTFGDMSHAHSPDIDAEIMRFVENDIPVFMVSEDAIDRGLISEDFLAGIEPVPRRNLPAIFAGYDQVWHW